MSKSTCNFKTLRHAIEEFSADATTFALADAGDGVDDANFVSETVNATILRLTKELTWMEEVLAPESSLMIGLTSTYADKVFLNEMNIAVQLKEQNYMFRDALKTGFYDLQATRDEYRLSCGALEIYGCSNTPNCSYLSTLCRTRLERAFVVKAGWPVDVPPDLPLKSANKYLQDYIVLTRKLLQKQLFGSKPAASASEAKVKGLIYVNKQSKTALLQPAKSPLVRWQRPPQGSNSTRNASRTLLSPCVSDRFMSSHLRHSCWLLDISSWVSPKDLPSIPLLNKGMGTILHLVFLTTCL